MKRLICILLLVLGCAGQKAESVKQAPQEIFLQDKMIKIDDQIQDMNDLTLKQKQDLFWFIQYFIYDLAVEQEKNNEISDAQTP